MAVLLFLAALYAGRRIVAREMLTSWLRSHGVASEIDLQQFNFGGLSGRVRVGDPAAPDFVAGDALVTWGLRGLNFEVRSVTLRRPTLRARLHDGQLSLGALDPLIEELRKRPPQPNTPTPRVEIDDAVLWLATDYGPVGFDGDVVITDGKLASLSARSSPAHLHGAAFDVVLGAGAASLRTTADRVGLALDAPLTSLTVRGLTVTHGRLSLAGQAPYPDLKRRRAEGAVTLRTRLTADQLALSDRSLGGVQFATAFQGRASGDLGDLMVRGQADADLRAMTGALAGARLGAIHATAKTDDLNWTRRGGDAISATPNATVMLQQMTAGDLQMSRVLARMQGPVRYGPGGFRVTATGSLSGRGGWRGLGPVGAADAPELAAIKRAARGFGLAAPALAVSLRDSGAQIALPQPLILKPDGGGSVIASARGDAPLFGPGGGALRVVVQGGGLPTLSADIRRLQFAGGGVTVRGDAKGAISIGPVEAGTVDVSGVLHAKNGGVSFTADRCLPITARKLEFGANDVERISGRLCPTHGPMFVAAKAGWRFDAKADNMAADAPFLQARIVDGTGNIAADQAAGRLAVKVSFDAARVLDEAASPRFNTLWIRGTAGFADDRSAADLIFSTLSGQPVATAALRQDARSGEGGLAIDTGLLTFAKGGLQPIDLSPVGKTLGAPVQGQMRFAGRFDWTQSGATSRGTLTVPGLDFQSAAGRVNGLRGAIAFSSLAPLIAPPGQTMSVEGIAAVVPITGVLAVFGLDEEALTVTAGDAAVGGGRVRIERLSVPLTGDAGISGVLDIEGVQLHDLIEASPFGDRVDLDAKVSGRLPFELQGGKLRIAGAALHAIQPGRLSINRHALAGVAAGGTVSTPTGPAAPVPANDTFTDFAYQAMENLAFDKLDAALASRDGGRLGILAHIVGRHDPPQHQEIRISLFDLIGRKFLSKPLPLPSGTGVDLTLDTTVNLDDLLTDYGDYQRLRGSREVQPAGPTTEAKPLEKTR